MVGIANLVDSPRRLNDEDIALAQVDKHCIPEPMIRSGSVDKWRCPWVLEDVKALQPPVPYSHPLGAVTWVNLVETLPAVRDRDESIERTKLRVETAPRMECRVHTSHEPVRRAASTTMNAPRPTLPANPIGTGTIHSVVLTEGNIRNNHIYLGSIIDIFPPDSIGGGNSSTAGEPITLCVSSDQPIQTDIAGDKRIFRQRSWGRPLFPAEWTEGR